MSRILFISVFGMDQLLLTKDRALICDISVVFDELFE